MKKQPWIFLCVIVGMLALSFRAAAQSPDESLVLGLSRTFGFGGLNGKIQGAFKLMIRSEHEALAQVDFRVVKVAYASSLR